MAFFDFLFGGDQKNQTVTTTPWKEQQPYLIQGFGQGANLYGNPYFYQQFPFSTVAPFSGAQQQGLQAIMDIAGNKGADLNTRARQQASQTLQGRFLGRNPYLDSMYAGMKRELLGPVNLGAEGMGRSGSGLAMSAAAQALNQARAATYGQHYESERNRQMDVLGMAPQLAATRYADPLMMLQAGGQIQQQGQRVLDDAFNRFQYGQNRPWDVWNQYMGNVGGNYGSAETQPMYRNTGASVLGGALQGGQLASLAGINPLYGILLGGLTGGF
jgi:hypothetical protein